MDRPEATLAKAVTRLEDCEHAIAEGRWRLSAQTMETVLRHTVGILTALQAAVVVGVQASS